MKTYTVFFEVFGKKLKVSKRAESEQDARQQIFDEIVFHEFRVEPEQDPAKKFIELLIKLRDSFGVWREIKDFTDQHPMEFPDNDGRENISKLVETFKPHESLLNSVIGLFEGLDDIMNPTDTQSKFQERLKQLAKERGINFNPDK